ncbi:T9SS type A sorting domain-containing protein [Flavobacterium sp.]|jgi:hypothetical protein|uniref:T9SS type A sorting domain-containing protein n=1 Tax=Flavobacterium sp. TaxID=239 RepID=UPI002A83DF3C|nr:T9SS type A sorting domain-containing protein [Flavobacterium sp.]
MKKLYFLLFTLTGMLSANSQTIYTENMGSPSSTTLISAYTGWQNTSPIVYTGDGDVRTSAASTGYSGASGSGNVFLTSTINKNLRIDGINTSAYTAANIELSFGYLTNSVAAPQLVLEKSTDGTIWTPITFAQNTTSNTWTLVTIGGGQIPSSTTLSLRFTQPATAQMRLDDIKIINVSASCTLNLGTPVVACTASTLSLDPYTITIPYTGAANATYTITGGTVSGNNPTTTAAGNIIVTVTEGTNYTINISGGTCNFDVNGNSPECKPINTLPYLETFNYTAAQTLGSQQRWTNVNSGDDVNIIAGNLTYGSTTGTGNSVEFSGDGKDPFTPFTATTTGTIYAGFMMRISDLTNVTDGFEDYFAILTDANKNFRAKLFTKRVGTQYQIGFDFIGGSSTTNYDATLRNVGDVVYVIMGYDFATTTLKAWLNPNLATFNAATPQQLSATSTIAEIGGFMIRQSGNTSTPTTQIDELKISTASTTFLGTISFDAIDGLNMYPNPSNGNTLYFTTAVNAELDIQVYDMLGKQVINSKVLNNALNISSLNQGIYIVKITEEGKTATRKLVVR